MRRVLKPSGKIAVIDMIVDEDEAEIRNAVKADLQGGPKTGLLPFIENGKTFITRKWFGFTAQDQSN